MSEIKCSECASPMPELVLDDKDCGLGGYIGREKPEPAAVFCSDKCYKDSNDSVFSKELESLINSFCKDNDSNTPDFILAKYIMGCLRTYEITIESRDEWFGFNPFGDK